MAGYTFPHDNYNSGSISMAEYEALTHTEGPDGTIGVTPTDTAPVYADGVNRSFWVRAGRYIRVRGKMYSTGLTDTQYTVTANSSGANRTDLVVARLTRSTGLITIEIKAGTTALTQDMAAFDTGVFEIPLAQVVIASGATAIPAGNVTSRAWFVNEEGQILCTTTTRPPHAAGRRCYESISSSGLTIVREILSDGSSWWGGDWTTLTYSAGFTTNTTVGEALAWRRNLDGAVELRGVVRKSDNSAFAAGSTSNISTVPAAIRPVFDRHHVQVVQFGASGMPAAKLQVTGTTGVVTVTANSDVSFTWVNFAEFRYHLF